MHLGKRGPRPKRSSSSLALAPHWRRFLRAQGLVDRNKALRSFTSSPSCRGSNATSVGHSPDKDERYGLCEPARITRKNICDCFKLNLGSFCHFTEEQTIRGPTVDEHARGIEPHHRHHDARQRLVAAGKPDQGVACARITASMESAMISRDTRLSRMPLWSRLQQSDSGELELQLRRPKFRSTASPRWSTDPRRFDLSAKALPRYEVDGFERIALADKTSKRLSVTKNPAPLRKSKSHASDFAQLGRRNYFRAP